MTDDKTFYGFKDAFFAAESEDGIVAYPVESIDISNLIPVSDDSVVYDVSSLLSTSHTYTFKLNPHAAWDLLCVLEGWKTDYTYRDGWNRRIMQGDIPRAEG